MTYPLNIRTEDYADEFPGYVLGQYFEQPRLKALIQGLLAPFESVETAIQDLKDQFGPSNATGAFLDAVGVDVEETRDGDGDAAYRRRVLAKVAANRSRGVWADLINVARLLYGDTDQTIDIRVSDHPPAEAYLEVQADIGTLSAAVANRIIQRAVPAGVRLQYHYWPSPADETFAFAPGSSIVTSDSDQGFGNTAMTTGGQFTEVLT